MNIFNKVFFYGNKCCSYADQFMSYNLGKNPKEKTKDDPNTCCITKKSTTKVECWLSDVIKLAKSITIDKIKYDSKVKLMDFFFHHPLLVAIFNFHIMSQILGLSAISVSAFSNRIPDWLVMYNLKTPKQKMMKLSSV